MSAGLIGDVVVPPNQAQKLKQSDEICTLCIAFRNIEGLPSANTGPNTTVRLQVCMYDTSHRRFFGRLWRGPKVPASDKAILDYSVNAYLHSSIIANPNFLLVVQVVVKRDQKLYLCGWGIIRPFKQGAAPLLDTANVDVPRPTNKMAAYFGSPRALLLLNEPIELNTTSGLKTIGGFTVLYSVAHHDSMEQALGFFPENVIVGQNDMVAGILRREKDPIWRPRFQKAVNCMVENVRVFLGPNLQAFETELRKRMNEDRLNRDNRTADDGASVNVIERRLHVGVHNGWTYVQPPEILTLIISRGRSDSGRRNSVDLAAPPNCLYARNRVHIEEIVEDKRCLLVFTLEYIVAEPVSTPGVVSGSQTLRPPKENRSVFLRVGEVNPLGAQQSQELRLKLRGAMASPYNSALLFKEPRSEQDVEQLCVEVHFRFSREDMGPLPLRPVPAQAVSVESSPARLRQPDRVERVDEAEEQEEELVAKHSTPRAAAARAASPAELSSRQDDALLSFRESLREPPTHYPYPVSTTVVQQPEQSSGSTVPGLGQSQAATISRGVYARLYTGRFPMIVDRNGEAPEVIDSVSPVQFELALEQQDPLLVNEVVLQFLAFSRFEAGDFAELQSVYFTLQFYRFEQAASERLQLASASEKNFLDQGADSDYSLPFVLQRDGPGAQNCGYTLRYTVDPTCMSADERSAFIEYLRSQSLQIDVWDGDSLMLVGSCMVELRRLCRQGCEAVQITYELDVTHTEYVEEPHAAKSQSVQVRMSTVPRGKLHLRLANVGHPALSGQQRLVTKQKRLVVMATDGVDSDPARAVHAVATPVLASNRELAEFLSARKVHDEPDNDVPAADEKLSEKSRKERRMMMVRREERASSAQDAQLDSVLAYRQSRNEKARDLQTIDEFRQQKKKDYIAQILQKNITAKHTIWPSFGTAEFFEYQFVNKTGRAEIISVHWDDSELQVVTETAEWHYFKSLHRLDTPIVENLFPEARNADSGTETEWDGSLSFVVQPRETVYVPFKFLSLQADHTVLSSVPQRANAISQFKTSRAHDTRHVRVYFLCKDTGSAAAVLELQIVPQPHCVDQTFRFYHPEQTFLHKSIRLPPFAARSGSEPVQLLVRCSEASVACQVRAAGQQQEVQLRLALGAAPQVKRFFVALFADPYAARPLQIWQLYAHAMQRVDVTCYEGQTSRFTLLLCGTQANRLAQCYCSHSDLQVVPKGPFMLASNAACSLAVALTSQQVGHRYMRLHVVDAEFKQLLHAWLVCAACTQSQITKAFAVTLPVGGGRESNKSIRYTNPYSSRRTFLLKTNRNDLVQFAERQITIAAGGTETIPLRFAPASSTGTVDVLVFVNDQDDKTEEAFCVRVTYV